MCDTSLALHYTDTALNAVMWWWWWWGGLSNYDRLGGCCLTDTEELCAFVQYPDEGMDHLLPSALLKIKQKEADQRLFLLHPCVYLSPFRLLFLQTKIMFNIINWMQKRRMQITSQARREIRKEVPKEV